MLEGDAEDEDANLLNPDARRLCRAFNEILSTASLDNISGELSEELVAVLDARRKVQQTRRSRWWPP